MRACLSARIETLHWLSNSQRVEIVGLISTNSAVTGLRISVSTTGNNVITPLLAGQLETWRPEEKHYIRCERDSRLFRHHGGPN